ncbi:MAG TPA: translocation/assembly module TamB domain-containing protein, partial [Ramlibacter sp.]|nr:translocation/assembly module TamB domain-containing protein [Ramlibacter sp.]
RLSGTVVATGGEYRAYGQRLNLERGELRFTGVADNPALDILAVRPNLLQRVGVQVSGRAQAPYVRLYAEPELPESEKLSWLVLGRASASGGAEAALLQQAAVALLASRAGGGGGKGPAAALGLDEVSFRRDGTDGPSITLGKRFAQNFYAAYERSLSGALGTLFVFYEVSRRVTVRAQAGERAAVDLIFTLSFD